MGVNLIPEYRHEARRRRARGRRWMAACVLYASALVFGYGICQATFGGSDPRLAEDLQTMQQDVSSGESTLARLKPELAEAQAKLDATRAVALQPDWSILMAALAQSLGDDVVLSSCTLQTQTISPPKSPVARSAAGDKKPGSKSSPAPEPERVQVIVNVTGFGRSQVAVSKFVLRLEQMRLFDRVKLIKTSREQFLDGDAVSFQLECPLGTAVTDSAAADAPGGRIR
jgi:Tfp pilus assembly protein PilN